MQALRVVMLLVTVAICYLLFVHSQTPADKAALEPPSAATVHSQYKADMDQARAAAKAMQAERKEADEN